MKALATITANLLPWLILAVAGLAQWSPALIAIIVAELAAIALLAALTCTRIARKKDFV